MKKEEEKNSKPLLGGNRVEGENQWGGVIHEDGRRGGRWMDQLLAYQKEK